MGDFTHRYVELFDEYGLVIFILWAIDIIWVFSKDDTKELAGCGCIIPIIAFILYLIFK